MVLEEQQPGELVQIIKKQKPYLKDTSIAQYIRSIKKLNQLINGENAELKNFNFIEDAKKIKEVLEQFHFTTRRNYYSAIITLLQAEDKPNKELIREYSDIVKEANTKYEEEQESGKVSEKQKEKLVDTNVVEDFVKRVKESKDEMLYILLRIITKYQTRNEIATLKLIKLRDFKKLKDEEKQGNNYLVMGSKKILIVRYDFKTNKKYKEITIEVDDKKLAKEIRSYVKTLNTDNVFEYKGEQLTPKKLTNLLLYQSKKLVGVPLSTTMLAKSILSEKYSDKNEEQKKDAKNRGHSVSVQNKVYVKSKE
tara:strand:- start:311 stop:1237 length:927 start_codon:yes stop_codon:yes gene_type:complete